MRITHILREVLWKYFVLLKNWKVNDLDRGDQQNLFVFDAQIHFSLDDLFNWIYFLQNLSHRVDQLFAWNASFFVFEFGKQFCCCHWLTHEISANSILSNTVFTANKIILNEWFIRNVYKLLLFIDHLRMQLHRVLTLYYQKSLQRRLLVALVVHHILLSLLV